MTFAFSPRIIVPTVFAVGVLAVLLVSSDLGRVLHDAGTFQTSQLALFTLLILGYEVLRAVQWRYFLSVLDRRAPWNSALMSYMGGELTKALPGGQYFQTYLLREAQGVPLSQSVAATTLIIWLEVIVCLATLLVLGVAPWPWVRPLAALLLLGLTLAIVALRQRALTERLGHLIARESRLRPAWQWVEEFAASASTLLHPRVVVVTLLLSAGYLGCAAIGLHVIITALGLTGIGLTQSLTIYCFSLAVGLLIPIPIDLGLNEVSGLTVLVAYGTMRADGLAVMLAQRVLSSVVTAAIAAFCLLLLRRQVAAVLRPRDSRS